MPLNRQSAFAIAVMIASGVTPAAADCRSAVDSYNTAISDISDRLKRYTGCLSSSQATYDCSSEFRRLRSAQTDFETAVTQHQVECHQ